MAGHDWPPTAPIDLLRKRAEIINQVRDFFQSRGVLEVETALLGARTVTDPNLNSLAVAMTVPGESAPQSFYLQTSPEFAMKRLLAAGSGPIFQICKAFRDAEAGAKHNAEFTMLEWYRPDWDHHKLMDEVDELLHAVLGLAAADRRTCAEVFSDMAGIDVHRDDASRLQRRCASFFGDDAASDLDREGCLSLLMARVVEPQLGRGRPTFLVDFPADQCALARVRDDEPPVAERFEVYIEGLELANGYHELTDPAEQRRRFENDLKIRRRRGLPTPTPDQRLLAALEYGLTDCAGIALGVDRLVMLATGATTIDEVIAFPIDRA